MRLPAFCFVLGLLRGIHGLIVRSAVLECRAFEREVYQLPGVVVLDVVAHGVAVSYLKAAFVRIPVDVVRPAV